jgi:hypothetical protein
MLTSTGFPRADVENEYMRARQRQALARLAGRLRRQPAECSQLRSLREVTDELGWRGQGYQGLQTIRLDTITGSAGQRHDFDFRFRPTSNLMRSRWEQLALAQRRGAPIPPIEVYRVGDQHFVIDGHHRVSIAMATGQKTIDAYVTEVITAAPLATGHSSPRTAIRRPPAARPADVLDRRGASQRHRHGARSESAAEAQ